MGKRLRIILLGIGRMGRNHLRLLSESPDFELVAVVDSASAAPINGVRFARSLDEIRSLDFDAAVVATPTATHHDIVLDLIRMKKHVLVEKPLASTFTQGRHLLDAASAEGVRIAVGHVERFNPAIRKVREVLRGGWLGEPIHFSFTRVGGYPETILEGNNVLLDLAVHDIDILRSFVGPLRVAASLCHSTWKPGVLDTGEIVLEAMRGPTASVHVNWITPTKLRTLRVTGTRGVCFVDYMLQTCELYGGNLTRRVEPQDLDTFEDVVEHYRATDRVVFGVAKDEPLRIELQQFARYLRDGEAGELCVGEDAIAAVLVAERAVAGATRKVPRNEGSTRPAPIISPDAMWV